MEEMTEAVTKVIDTLTQEDFHGVFKRLLERYNKYIATGGDYFEGELEFHVCTINKVPIRKKSGNLFNDLRIYTKIYIQIHTFAYVYLHKYIYMYIYTFTYTYIQIHIHVHILKYSYIYIYIYIYLYTYFHIRI